jgi:hypothetical protein
MSESLQSAGSLLPEESIYAEVARQIYKDFVSCGAVVSFPEKAAYPFEETLHANLLPAVHDLMQRNRPMLMKIIYRVDIPEARLGRVLENLALDEASGALTTLIIEREKQKIHLRKQL